MIALWDENHENEKAAAFTFAACAAKMDLLDSLYRPCEASSLG